MAKAKAEVTISRVVDISSVTRYYLLQVSTASAPAKPTANPPGGSWTKTEPTYTAGSTNTLYTVELTVFTNNTFSYSDVSKSTSYEAAKSAYNKALEAAKTATNYVKTDTTGLIVGNVTASTLGYNTLIKTGGVDIRNGSTVLASFGQSLIELGKNSDTAVVKLCGGTGLITNTVDDIDSNWFTIESTNYLSLSAPQGIYLNSYYEQDNVGIGSYLHADVFETVDNQRGSVKLGLRGVSNRAELSMNDTLISLDVGPDGVAEGSCGLGLDTAFGRSILTAPTMVKMAINGIVAEGLVHNSITVNEDDLEFVGLAKFSNHIRIPNKYAIQSYDTNGNAMTILHMNASNNLVLGYSGYDNSIGATYVYGNQVRVVSRDDLFYANGYLVPKMTKGDTSYYGLMTPENSTAGWIRTTESGLIPSAHGVSSIGSSSWQFKNGYFQNLYVGGNNINTWTSVSVTNASIVTDPSWTCLYNSALNLVSIRGYVGITPTSDIAAHTSFTIATLPTTIRPTAVHALSVYRHGSYYVKGHIAANGTVNIMHGGKLTANTEYGFYVQIVYYKDV